jgi:DNA-directed RNA polymerase specialized sigma24 family protein
MNCNDTNPPPFNIDIALPCVNNKLHAVAAGDIKAFENFVHEYSNNIFRAVCRLTGSTDGAVIETITVNIFVDMWHNKVQFFPEKRPSLFIYKTLLQHVMQYLHQQGNHQQLCLLQSILIAKPPFYSSS